MIAVEVAGERYLTEYELVLFAEVFDKEADLGDYWRLLLHRNRQKALRRPL